MKTRITPPVNVKTGAFPFPIINGPRESRYLTWLRNHSNYILGGGLTDYLRVIAVLVRGIILNFLILLPSFLVFAVLLALVNLFLTQPQSLTFTPGATPPSVTVTLRSNFGESATLTAPFRRDADHLGGAMQALARTLAAAPGQFRTLRWYGDCERTLDRMDCAPNAKGEETTLLVATNPQNGVSVTVGEADFASAADGTAIERSFGARSRHFFSGIVLAIAALCVIAYPVLMRMRRVHGYARTLRTGHLSSVKYRDRFERAFGALLLLILVVAALETFPRIAVWFHGLRHGQVAAVIPILAAMVAAMVLANRLLPRLGGVARNLGLLAVGLLGLAIPLTVVLFVVEFLAYSDKRAISGASWDLYFIVALVLLPAIFAVLLFGTWLTGLRSFRLRGHLQLLGLTLAMVALVVAVAYVARLLDAHYPELLFSFYVLAFALELAIYCWLAVDVNQTSINGLYRDRLASAYLIGVDTTGDIDIEQDINLQEICNYDAGSTAPYHLINAALNLQASTDIGIRDRNSDFFVLSKRFIGSERTGYCRSEHMEAVFPRMDLGTAMAISAAAAAPNMGRATNPLVVAFLTLLNIRLGFWIPHPDRLEKYLAKKKYIPGAHQHLDFTGHIFPAELDEIAKRRAQVYGGGNGDGAQRPLARTRAPSTAHGLVGLAFSGGGIRSATLNLGIAQELHRRGVFDHVDYLSTVSGGGYIGASISTLMRHRSSPYAEVSGRLVHDETGALRIEPDDPDTPAQVCRFAADASLMPGAQTPGARVTAGQRLLQPPGTAQDARDKALKISLMDSFSWRVRPSALRREMMSRLDETHPWVNLSDGGHIENLAVTELLRRRCRIIFVGDAEGDAHLHFAGLATLLRYARIDLGIDIDIDVNDIRLRGKRGLSRAHGTIGRITYPPDPDNGIESAETGYLVYLKSTVTGDEDEVILEYRNRNPDFPHESTADQMFGEGQFEAYRALGQHIAASILPPQTPGGGAKLDIAALERWILAQDLPAPTWSDQLLAQTDDGANRALKTP